MTEQEFLSHFEDSFMKPQIFESDYFEVETTIGTECIPQYFTTCTMTTIAEYFLDYLEGTPLDNEAEAELKHGFVCRMSASGYTDCTAYSAFNTLEEAMQHLVDMYGNE